MQKTFLAILLAIGAATAGKIYTGNMADFEGSVSMGDFSNSGANAFDSRASNFDSGSSGFNSGSSSASSGFGSGSFASSSGSAGGYGGQATRTETRCRPAFDTVQEDRCENYQERVCTTQQREACNDVADQNCRAIVTTKQIRKCFNVTEILCGLKEDIKFETVQVGFTVQRCRKIPERVCDTVFEAHQDQSEDVQCMNVENPVCDYEERTLQEKTCRTTTQFDCQTQNVAAAGYGPAAGAGNVASYGAEGSNAGGYGGNAGSNNGYGAQGASAGGYGAAPVEPQVTCQRRQETKCFNTPRTVNVPRCERRSEKVCERVRLSNPTVDERQSCRNEEKKICELEERTQPKQVKKYVYTKQCRSVPRSVCESSDVAQLVPSCVPSTRKECTYSPVEQCENIPKQHCFKVNKQIRREQCEQVQVPVNSGVSNVNAGNNNFGNQGGNFNAGFGNSGSVVDASFGSGNAGFSDNRASGFGGSNSGFDASNSGFDASNSGFDASNSGFDASNSGFASGNVATSEGGDY